VTEARVRVAIVEDQEIFRRGLCAQFDADPRIEVVAEFDTAYEAVLKIPELRPSVTLMDLRLPWKSNERPRYCGAEAIKQILQQWPEAAIAVITAFADKERFREALRAGARGFVEKEARAEELIQTVHQTAAGSGSLSSSVVHFLPDIIGSPANGGADFTELTRRENEILKLYGEGKTIDDIGRILNIKRKTVDNRLSDIPGKLKLETRQEAAELSREVGLSRGEEPDNPVEAG
jgi:two-component system, NarL family, response regulator DevR